MSKKVLLVESLRRSEKFDEKSLFVEVEYLFVGLKSLFVEESFQSSKICVVSEWKNLRVEVCVGVESLTGGGCSWKRKLKVLLCKIISVVGAQTFRCRNIPNFQTSDRFLHKRPTIFSTLRSSSSETFTNFFKSPIRFLKLSKILVTFWDGKLKSCDEKSLREWKSLRREIIY